MEDNPEQHGRFQTPEHFEQCGGLRLDVGPEAQRHMQASTNLAGLVRHAFQHGRIARIAQIEIDPEMRETQRLEPFNLTCAERALMAGRAQTQRRQRMHRRRRNGELRRAAHVDRQDGTDFSTERERDGLLDAIALGDGVRLRARLRRAIGLEGCIAPVALIFHLEDISLHFDLRGDAGVHHFVAERLDIEERLMRGNLPGEQTLFTGAVRVFDADRFAGALRDGMQDA